MSRHVTDDRSANDASTAASESAAVSLPALKELLRTHATAEEHARWFILLRWIAVTVAVALIVIAVHVLEVLPQEVWLPLMGTVAVLALLNLAYARLLRTGRAAVAITSFQAYADLIWLTVLIHFSGGIENPLVLLMIFHVIIAGITLSRRQCFAVAGAATILFALLAWAEATSFVDHYTLRIVPHYEEHGHTAHAAHDPVFASSFVGLQGTILFLTAFFVTTLAERLRQRERQLESLAERALTQRQLLEQSLETTGTGLYVSNARLQPILTNRRWEDWFAQAGDNDVHAQLSGTHAPLEQTLQDGTVRVTEIAQPDGDDRHALSTASRTFQATTAPLVDRDGRITHVVQLVQDVTEQKAAQAQMIRAGKLAAVGELAGQVAHEVNNPIAIISAKARLLLSDHRDGMSDRTVDDLEKIVHLADRVARIAQGLLSYCRPPTATRAPIDAGIPLRRALAMIEQRARHAGIDIDDQVPSSLPPVHANAQEMEQVFLNLFLNALDAMPGGGRLVTSAHSDATDYGAPTLRLCVEDTGLGMTEDVRRHVFEPFFTTKPEGKGTGLGLSICHGIIQHYGGTIEVTSAPAKGTEIIIRLPLHQLDNETRHG